MKRLSDAKQGEHVKVSCIDCGCRLRDRLSSLGLYCGKDIEIIRNDTKGPILVKIFNSKIIIGRGQAEKIVVEGC